MHLLETIMINLFIPAVILFFLFIYYFCYWLLLTVPKLGAFEEVKKKASPCVVRVNFEWIKIIPKNILHGCIVSGFGIGMIVAAFMIRLTGEHDAIFTIMSLSGISILFFGVSCFVKWTKRTNYYCSSCRKRLKDEFKACPHCKVNFELCDSTGESK